MFCISCLLKVNFKAKSFFTQSRSLDLQIYIWNLFISWCPFSDKICAFPSFSCLQAPASYSEGFFEQSSLLAKRLWESMTEKPRLPLGPTYTCAVMKLSSLLLLSMSIGVSTSSLVSLGPCLANHASKRIKCVQFSSATQSCPALCDPMKRSTPGLPVHHQLPEFTQTHIHRVSDAIQPSRPL